MSKSPIGAFGQLTPSLIHRDETLLIWLQKCQEGRAISLPVIRVHEARRSPVRDVSLTTG